MKKGDKSYSGYMPRETAIKLATAVAIVGGEQREFINTAILLLAERIIKENKQNEQTNN